MLQSPGNSRPPEEKRIEPFLASPFKQTVIAPKLDGWSLVVPGAWNRQILTPSWLAGASGVTQSTEIQVEVSVDDIMAPRRILFDDVILEVSSARLVLRPQSSADDTLKHITTAAKKIIEQLPHTPIRGVGINFGYTDSEPGKKLRDLFNFADATAIAQADWSAESSVIQRKLIKQDRVLNLKVEYKADNAVDFLVNFHFEAKNAASAAGALTSDIIALREESVLLLNKIYY